VVVLIDENVPDAVAQFLQRRGHVVHYVRHELALGTSDKDVARHANDLGGIVVTWNYKDFAPCVAACQPVKVIELPAH
jgi:predicted nuclease of predicted toxin-antitoxin system